MALRMEYHSFAQVLALNSEFSEMSMHGPHTKNFSFQETSHTQESRFSLILSRHLTKAKFTTAQALPLVKGSVHLPVNSQLAVPVAEAWGKDPEILYFQAPKTSQERISQVISVPTTVPVPVCTRPRPAVAPSGGLSRWIDVIVLLRAWI